jgi:hypothetical protein
MSTNLPISISISDELLDEFVTIKRIVNKLEIQLNFKTLAAGWYGDEENILLISLYLQSPTDFDFQQTQSHGGELTCFSDDVFSYYNEQQKQLSCFIAVTSTEHQLLQQKEKILSGYLPKKLMKVINLIAIKLLLPTV